MGMSRREALATTGMGVLGAGVAWPALAAAPVSPGVPAGTAAAASLEALPGKRPLIKLSWRPPNYETPAEYFKTVITPNDAFFVRYHLSEIPEVDAGSWKVRIGGEGVAQGAEYGLDELRQMETVEIVAVCQCSGNRRGLSQPHVAGVEWGYGAMGNARWKGVRLKDLLAKAGITDAAVEVAFNGADGPPVEATPDFVKSLPAWKAMDEHTLIAFEMNGEPLPHWNGFPARLVVPGWTATYWMKHLTDVSVRTQPLSGFWMNPAYRLPKAMFPLVQRFTSQEGATNTPITEIMVNSLITAPVAGAAVPAGQEVAVEGIAWDGGYGIDRVEVSLDGGASWAPATLGEDLGPYSFRPWRFAGTPAPGKATITARASNRQGQSQAPALLFNGAGYHNNVPQRIEVTVA